MPDGKLSLVKNIHTKIRKMNSDHEPVLNQRLQEKYLLDYNIADIWIHEYYKYLIINMNKGGKTIPPSSVEKVWYTHMEFTKEYRDFIVSIFGRGNRHILPHHYDITNDNVEELTAKYVEAQEEHEKLFTEEPKIGYWSVEANRFKKYNEMTVNIDLFRVTAAYVLKTIKPDVYCFRGSKIKDPHSDIIADINQTNINKESRNDHKKENKPYHWRIHFPHFHNIYEDAIVSDDNLDGEIENEDQKVNELLLEARESFVNDIPNKKAIKT